MKRAITGAWDLGRAECDPVTGYYEVMKRTTVVLSDELARVLEREAHRRHESVSQIARHALAAHLGLDRDTPRELPFAAVGGSGRSDIARNLEDLIEREWNDHAGGG
jgi:hypothetical protein